MIGMPRKEQMYDNTCQVKQQLENRWSTKSSAALHKQHQWGPIQPFFIRLSQVWTRLVRHNQLKQIIFWGMWNFQIWMRASVGLLMTAMLAIISYIKLALTKPVILLYIHTSVSGVLLMRIPPWCRPLMYWVQAAFQWPPSSSSYAVSQYSVDVVATLQLSASYR